MIKFALKVEGTKDIVRRLIAEGRRAEAAAAIGVAAATRKRQVAVRAIVGRGFKGGRIVANAIRSKLYHDAGRGATGLIYATFGSRKTGRPGFVDFVLPRLLGQDVRPAKGRYLIVPLDPRFKRFAQGSAGVMAGLFGRRGRAKAVGAARIKWIPIKGGRFLIVEERKNQSIPLAIAVKRVRFPAVASRGELAGLGVRGLEQEIVAAWNRGRAA